MILIVGLGNYGAEYANTLHNCGFMSLDLLAKKEAIKIDKSKCHSLIYVGKLFDEEVVLAKPQTYMNNSGLAVKELLSKFSPNKFLIIFDDVDIEFGKIRFRQNGSAGTHNGMKNIVEQIKSTDFPRIRIGIKPDVKPNNLADYVLGKVPFDKKEELFCSLEQTCEKVEEFIKNKIG